MLLALSLLALALAATPPVPQPAPAGSPSAISRSPPPASPVDAQAKPEGTTYLSKKGVAELEKCLTDRLSKVGEVTSVPIEGMKTLMYSTTDEPPMMINIDPPSVIVTTRFAIGTQPIVKGCL
jgi:hypothetical protein